ncbi:hypothetical protein TSMEX_006727 [Taenia solium]|eukprot:TsM_000887000 transcript=TsM_000887000 gene=TsM_000887000
MAAAFTSQTNNAPVIAELQGVLQETRIPECPSLALNSIKEDLEFGRLQQPIEQVVEVKTAYQR